MKKKKIMILKVWMKLNLNKNDEFNHNNQHKKWSLASI